MYIYKKLYCGTSEYECELQWKESFQFLTNFMVDYMEKTNVNILLNGRKEAIRVWIGMRLSK